MQCKPCARNGRRHEGGSLGYCQRHRDTKCLVCKSPSLGEELCAAHTHQAQLLRWTARAELRVTEPGSEFDQAQLRREKLLDAKFLAHEAVEVFFRSLLGVTQSIYGAAPADEEKDAA